MTTEESLVREVITTDGTAFVIPNGLNHLYHPRLTSLLKTENFPQTLFDHLIKLTDPDKFPIEYDGEYPLDNPVEHITVRTADTPKGKIEITETIAYAPHTLKMRLHTNDSIQFEAILVGKGVMKYRFPKQIIALSTGYFASEKYEVLELHEEDLAIIPFPVARGIVEVEKGTEYRYLSAPWDSKHTPAEVFP
jgi:hypothetical protein